MSGNKGRIFQINASGGGVPKYALPEARVTALGVIGDVHRNTEVHGGPERAVCLYSLEHILALQADGHPIFPGAVGENLTLAGIDWLEMKPGVQMKLGDAVLVEITRYTMPCNTISGAFLEGDYGRISQTRFPGWSRVYARVLQEGTIGVAQPAVVLSS